MGQSDFRKRIPLLQPRIRIQDTEEIKAWYAAVADALRGELVIDLFAMWLYGADGLPVLIEPEALMEDQVEIPPADPIANQLKLDEVEARVVRAGYSSVLLRPIRFAGQDVGLVLLGAFQPHIYGHTANRLVDDALDVIAPMLARVTRAGSGAAGEEAGQEPRPAEPESAATVPTGVEREQAQEGVLFESLASAIGGTGSPRDLMLALSFALQPILPHEAYELLIPDGAGERHYRLGLHGYGGLWGDPGLVWEMNRFDPSAWFAQSVTVLVTDTAQEGALTIPEWVIARGPDAIPRSLVGVRLQVVERPVGYLFFGSAGPDFYQSQDAVLLDRVGSLLAPRVDAIVLAWQLSVIRGQFDVLRHVPMHLARVAELLAVTPVLGEGARLFLQQAQALLPVAELEFAVKLSDDQRVAVVKPGSQIPLADLPQEPITGTGVAEVVRGKVPYLLTTTASPTGTVAVLVVPLRAGGRIFGAMAITSTATVHFSRTDMALAQQLADLIAPHLDLVRRSGGPPPPFIPGWKRPMYRGERERSG